MMSSNNKPRKTYEKNIEKFTHVNRWYTLFNRLYMFWESQEMKLGLVENPSTGIFILKTQLKLEEVKLRPKNINLRVDQ